MDAKKRVLAKADVERALFCSTAAYKDSPEEAQAYLRPINEGLPAHEQIKTALFSSQKGVFIALSQDATFVAFRGTKNLEDMVSDMEANLTQSLQEGSFHKGFWDRLQLVAPLWETGRQPLKEYPGRLVLCGHSLGGATSHVVLVQLLMNSRRASQKTEDMQLKLLRPEEVKAELAAGQGTSSSDQPVSQKSPSWLERADPISIAFGAPHFCDKLAAEYINQRAEYSSRFHTFVNYDDPVPRLLSNLPAALLSLAHGAADELSRPFRGLLALLGVCTASSTADEGLQELGGVLARVTREGLLKRGKWGAVRTAVQEAKKLGLGAVCAALLPHITRLREEVLSRGKQQQGGTLYSPVGAYYFLAAERYYEEGEATARLVPVKATEQRINDDIYLGSISMGTRHLLNHALVNYDVLVESYDDNDAPSASGSASDSEGEPSSLVVTCPQPEVHSAYLSDIADAPTVLVAGKELRHLVKVQVLDLLREDLEWKVTDFTDEAIIVTAVLKKSDEGAPILPEMRGIGGTVKVATVFGTVSHAILQKPPYKVTGAPKFLRMLAQTMTVTALYGGWKWDGVPQLLDQAERQVIKASDYHNGRQYRVFRAPNQLNNETFARCFDVLTEKIDDRSKGESNKEAAMKTFVDKADRLATLLASSFFFAGRGNKVLTGPKLGVLQIVGKSMREGTWAIFCAYIIAGTFLIPLLSLAGIRGYVLQGYKNVLVGLRLSMLEHLDAKCDEHQLRLIVESDEEQLEQQLIADGATLSLAIKGGISSIWHEFNARMAILKACSAIKHLVDIPLIVGVVGMENGGKSAFIQGVLDVVDPSRRKPRPTVGDLHGETAEAIHTTDVKPYWVDKGVALADFPGMDGAQQREYVKEWKKFTHLAAVNVFILKYQADPTEETLRLIRDDLQEFAADEVLVVMNRMDEPWGSPILQSKEKRLKYRESLRVKFGLPEPKPGRRHPVVLSSFQPPPWADPPERHPLYEMRRDKPAEVDDVLDARGLMLEVLRRVPEAAKAKTVDLEAKLRGPRSPPAA